MLHQLSTVYPLRLFVNILNVVDCGLWCIFSAIGPRYNILCFKYSYRITSFPSASRYELSRSLSDYLIVEKFVNVIVIEIDG